MDKKEVKQLHFSMLTFLWELCVIEKEYQDLNQLISYKLYKQFLAAIKKEELSDNHDTCHLVLRNLVAYYDVEEDYNSTEFVNISPITLEMTESVTIDQVISRIKE